MGSRYRGEEFAGGGFLAVITSAAMSATSFLMGIEAVLNVQFLPSQMSDAVKTIATSFGLPLPQVGMVFLASAPIWLTIGFVLGRATK